MRWTSMLEPMSKSVVKRFPPEHATVAVNVVRKSGGRRSGKRSAGGGHGEFETGSARRLRQMQQYGSEKF
jgi:hypothetical protein